MPSAWVRPQQKPDPEAIPFYLGARASASQDESGLVLAGRYELVEVLASGGTAVVYNATDTWTGGSVAVKVLYEAAREVVGAFFGQEGRLAARIQSPHLVHARHFGEDDGRLFIVFDLVPGVALPHLYFQELMPWRELCVVVLQVLAGLDALHQDGIVHRDVKPDNIIVLRTLGDDVHVTLLDLGFAWVPPERNLTGAPEPTRQVFGTDRFIAPELLGGGLPEPRNDLYSVGALMYVMLTAQSVPDLSAAPELMELPPPRAFVPGIPQRVDDIVMRALSDVEARFQSAEEMAAAVRAALTDEASTSSAMLRAGREPRASDEAATSTRAPHGASSPSEEPAVVISAPEAASSGPAMVAGPGVGSGGPVSLYPALSRGMAAQDVPASVKPAIAAAMLLSAVLGGTFVWLAGRSPRPFVEGASTLLAAEGSQPVGGPGRIEPATTVSPGSTSEQPTSSEPMKVESVAVAARTSAPALPAPGGRGRTPPAASAPAVAPPAPAARASVPSVLAAGEMTRARTGTSGADATSRRRAMSFLQVMGRIEPDIRDCITRKTGKEPERAIDVRVRFDPVSGAIDQVRVLDMGSANPIVGCIDGSVRSAAPPSAGRPNETFTFFKNKGPAPG